MTYMVDSLSYHANLLIALIQAWISDQAYGPVAQKETWYA